MAQFFLAKAKKMASDAGFHDVRYAGKWNEYDIFEPIFTDEFAHYTGLPVFILSKDGALKWEKTPEICFEIIDALK